ncbi:MAG: hypothetical protein A2286_10440 [Gammaproteobacteria bacterium RIFOXYA12_FULL_61_12]|nr:MAG: hypothetical protein A2286_10440 [Gammaproteobacteria bacterium RIFOXYA12_FULL_61_12]
MCYVAEMGVFQFNRTAVRRFMIAYTFANSLSNLTGEEQRSIKITTFDAMHITVSLKSRAASSNRRTFFRT